MERNTGQVKYSSLVDIVNGNQPSLKQNTYWIIRANTMEGTDINRMIKMLMTWSCHLFFLSAAKIPKPRPMGTPISVD